MLTWTTFQRSPRRSIMDPCSGTDLSPSMSRSLSSVFGSPLYRNTICLACPMGAEITLSGRSLPHFRIFGVGSSAIRNGQEKNLGTPQDPRDHLPGVSRSNPCSFILRVCHRAEPRARPSFRMWPATARRAEVQLTVPELAGEFPNVRLAHA